MRGETIAAIGRARRRPPRNDLDHGDKLILPGLVDGHMHTSSSTGWPGIETATTQRRGGRRDDVRATCRTTCRVR